MIDTVGNVDEIDKHVDDEIAACLNLRKPRSFFLFAGAGSGKTRSLVEALKHIGKTSGEELRLHDKHVAVVTYTKKARDEIISRTQFDPLFEVSTIHAFAWSIIRGFNHDIREWLRENLTSDIADLRQKENKGRKGTKASAERLADIEAKSRRLAQLDAVSSFVYNPDGENRGKGSLNHSDVLKMSGAFLRDKKVLQRVVRDGYPFILIDESQDTNKNIVEAMFAFQAQNRGAVALGLFGDMMQRIYPDGVANLGSNLPPDWATPVKKLNFRCPKRIITLLNKIREATDNQKQVPKSTATEGTIRMFIMPSSMEGKPSAELDIAKKMATITGDQKWGAPDQTKCLILEHKMAAKRLGFLEMFSPLYAFDPFRTGLRDGNLPCVAFFATSVAPLIEARDDKFAIMRVLNKFSPLLSPETLREANDQKAHLKKLQNAVESLFKLFASGSAPTFLTVLQEINKSRLFSIPDVLRPALAGAQFAEIDETALDWEEGLPEERSQRDVAVASFLAAPFSQIWLYQKYVQGLAQFDTHQGVKGLEFPRVMVVMDDSEAGGFSFKYDKLFTAGSEDDAITANTRRLFYVTCSRAEHSLCLVAYSADPQSVKNHVVSQGWFEDDEVLVL
ncbi:UvrD-helicase domain-containing protein [Rhizobium sp. 1399]|uniref:UvrD-helicase domain-containing protein n=1 Tax=Rhizobium sp. 1399 TaxID=2817758 RepID=UPI0028665095|nr:UvrD-helicase domain-containing protein [Rhizobium sp. 1399]MDR6669769.1 DNA helicase-2/ATP-dependent DNA helicase PcrA [Rhizobium sp. 1399]